MPSFWEEQIQEQYYNLDGTMRPEYRKQLYNDGWSEAKIGQLEQMHIRNAAIYRKVAEWQQELESKRSELKAQAEKEMRQQAECLGIEYNPPYTSVNNFTQQTRAEKMAGLDPEELLSQGFLEPDDFYDPESEADKEAYQVDSCPAYEPPDIPF